MEEITENILNEIIFKEFEQLKFSIPNCGVKKWRN